MKEGLFYLLPAVLAGIVVYWLPSSYRLPNKAHLLRTTKWALEMLVGIPVTLYLFMVFLSFAG